MKREKILPHHNVYTRLQPSKIHGVGVFAIRDIPKGVNIFKGDKSEMDTCINKSDVENFDEEIKKLYVDFCVLKGDKYICPDSFNNLTVGWYLNHSKNPNVRCDENYEFFALRDIKKGEELTVDYSTYSDNELMDKR